MRTPRVSRYCPGFGALIDAARPERRPYKWAPIDALYTPHEASALALAYPRDHFKVVRGYDGEKGYEYHARCLVGMGSNRPVHAEALSPAWFDLAVDLTTLAYRASISLLAGMDLGDNPIEINIFHYGPGAWLGPHVDLRDKIATHVLYFNERWEL